MTPLNPAAAARAMAVHRIAIAHSCWLRRTASGELHGCPVGALYFATHGVIADAAKIIAWAGKATGSADYVAGFDDGFHAFAPSKPHTANYAAGLTDGRRTRVIVDAGGPGVSPPPLFRPIDCVARTGPTGR